MHSFVAIAQSATITTKLDSAYILMGKQTTLHLDVVTVKDVNGELIKYELDKIVPEVEIIKEGEFDTINIGNGRLQIKQDITIQSFDSGLYTLPPFKYKLNNDTIYSNELVLKVIPVNVDSMTSILGYQDDVFQYDSKWYDILPDFITDYWYWIIIVLILFVVVLYIIFRLIQRQPIISPIIKKKIIPPYELALQKISQLKEAKLWEKGHEKEYYTQLIDIIREYLVLRFNINAMEMTSSQILYALKSCENAQNSISYMDELLSLTDFVKFAKFSPLPDENIKAMNLAIKFLEETKPIVPSEDNIKDKSNQE